MKYFILVVCVVATVTADVSHLSKKHDGYSYEAPPLSFVLPAAPSNEYLPPIPVTRAAAIASTPASNYLPPAAPSPEYLPPNVDNTEDITVVDDAAPSVSSSNTFEIPIPSYAAPLAPEAEYLPPSDTNVHEYVAPELEYLPPGSA